MRAKNSNWIIFVLLFLLVSVNFQIEAKASEVPSWVLNIEDNEDFIFGVGQGKYKSYSNSKKAADLASRKCLVDKVISCLLSLKSQINDTNLTSELLFDDESIKQIASAVSASSKIQDRFEADDGSIWSLSSFRVSEISDIAQNLAFQKVREIESKISYSDSQLEEFLSDLEKQRKMGIERHSLLVSEYKNQISSIDPEYYSQIVLKKVQGLKNEK